MHRTLIALASLLLIGQVQALAPVVKQIDPPDKILFVGNSFTYYNDNLHSHLRNLMRAGKLNKQGVTRVRSLTLSGGHLHEHVGALRQHVVKDAFDLVVMHGHSTAFQKKSTAERFDKVAKLLALALREQGTEPAFLMTWAYKDRPGMLKKIARGYTKTGNKLEALVIPAGNAFELARKKHPEIELYSPDIRSFDTDSDGSISISYKKDVKHPSSAGTYLTACTAYAALFQKSPVGLPYHSDLSVETAKQLQQIAWETVADYYGR